MSDMCDNCPLRDILVSVFVFVASRLTAISKARSTALAHCGRRYSDGGHQELECHHSL